MPLCAEDGKPHLYILSLQHPGSSDQDGSKEHLVYTLATGLLPFQRIELTAPILLSTDADRKARLRSLGGSSLPAGRHQVTHLYLSLYIISIYNGHLPP